MKLSAAKVAAFSCLFFAESSTAQYFSAGWTPGQKAAAAATAETSVKPYAPKPSGANSQSGVAPAAASPSSFIDRLLTSGPAAALFNSFGVNITEKVNAKLWDDRIQLITDDNYQDVIVNERLTPQQEKDRAWVIMITGQAVKQDEASKLVDKIFDSAYDLTMKAGDLPHIKWGRIDYLKVTRITTKWGVWQAPYLVVLSDRGKTLRFYRHYQLRFREDNLREFLKKKEYLLTQPWSSEFSPGGEREYILDYLATILCKVYNVTVLIPRWLLIAISGGIGSILLGLLHRPSKETKQDNKPVQKPAVADATPSASATTKAEDPKSVPVVTATTDSKPPTAPTASSSPKSTSKPSTTTTTSKSSRSASPSRSATKTLTPAATDSERESSTGAPAAKRSSARQRKTKKT